MTTRGDQTLAWDVENRLTSVSEGGQTLESYVYDGDGQRVKKTAGAQTNVYVNRYYHKEGATVVKQYYSGGKMVAVKEGTTLRYVHQDSLGSSSVSSDTAGATSGTISYKPFGSTRTSTGTLGTEKKFTGQIADGTGLYYFKARYYDSELGRFTSVDPIIPNNPSGQALDPYSYGFNNPFKYVDPTGKEFVFVDEELEEAFQLILSNYGDDEWIKQMLLQLDESPQIFQVAFGSNSWAAAGPIILGATGIASGFIRVDEDTLEFGLGTVASVFAHEAYHAYESTYEGNIAASIEEETIGYFVQWSVGGRLGLYFDTESNWNGFAWLANKVVTHSLDWGGPVNIRDGRFEFSDEFLDSVRTNVLGNGHVSKSDYYDSLPRRREDVDSGEIWNQILGWLF